MSWVTPKSFAAQVIENFRNLPGGEFIAITDTELEACVIMAFEHFDTTSRPVMNPPADEAEARNRANTAPRQADSAAVGRGMAGPLTESEAWPVMPTTQSLDQALGIGKDGHCIICGDPLKDQKYLADVKALEDFVGSAEQRGTVDGK
jgi:hypothetical protein